MAINYELLFGAAENESDLFNKYDRPVGLIVNFEPQAGLSEQKYRITARAEFIENILDEEFEHTSAIAENNLEFSLEGFLDYIKGISGKTGEKSREIIAIPEHFTFTVEISDMDGAIVHSGNLLIENPWKDDNEYRYWCDVFKTESGKLKKSNYARMLFEAGKIIYGDDTTFHFESIGLDLPEGGNAPFMAFDDDFVWIKHWVEYPGLAVDEIKKRKLSGYFIYEEDYNYLCCVLTHGQCNVDTFVKTIKTMNELME